MAKAAAPLMPPPQPIQRVHPPIRISVKPEKKVVKEPVEEPAEPAEDPTANVHQDDDYGQTFLSKLV